MQRYLVPKMLTKNKKREFEFKIKVIKKLCFTCAVDYYATSQFGIHSLDGSIYKCRSGISSTV